ncbi:MAG: protein kinase, partial [Muribaculaceae bacterium]
NDIKPENILVTRINGDAKLIDFGLSDNDAFYVNKHLGGTPRYASPELLAQNSEIDSRSDIYSLGMILRDIFGNKYSSITERCMQKDKALRYRDAEELMNAWHHRDRRFHLSLVALAVLAVIGAGWAYLSVVDRRGSESLSQVEALRDSLAVSRLQSAVASRQLDSVTAILDSIGAVEKAQNELFPIVKKQIDDTVSAIKSDLRKIAKREKIRELYLVFACERLKDLWKIKDIIADSGLNADGKVTLNKYYEDCYAECGELMRDIYKNMESLFDFEREKRDFYLELSNKHEHYRPYVEQ